MIPKFDIFRLDPDGKASWLKTAETFEEARMKAQQLAANSHGQHLILDQNTGKKIVVDHTELTGPKSDDSTNRSFSQSQH